MERSRTDRLVPAPAGGIAGGILAAGVLAAGVLAAPSGVAPRGAERGVERGAPVTPYVVDVDLRDLPRPAGWQPGDPIREIPQRFFVPPGTAPIESRGFDFDEGARRQRAWLAERAWLEQVDPTAATGAGEADAARGAGGPGPFTVPDRNFTGQGFTGVNPPDTVGDVGNDHYIQAINSGNGAIIRIWDKAAPTPNELTTFFLDSLGNGACANGLGDPIVLWDRQAQRWLLTEFSAGANNLCVYLSQTADPVSGGWLFYQFTTPSFPDYPKYAVWDTDANGGAGSYVVTANDGGPGVYALDRGAMLAGEAATFQRRPLPPLSGFAIQAPTPADPDGPSPVPAGEPALIMRHRDTESHGGSAAGDLLEMWFFDVDWENPANTTLVQGPPIVVAEFDSRLCGLSTLFCFPQPTPGATTVMPLREPIHHRLQYFNHADDGYEALVGNFITDVDGTDLGGLRWFELRRSAPGDPWALHQEGTWSPDDDNRFIGASSADQAGNIALAYNIVSENVFPSLRYTGRAVDDPLGLMTQPETTIHPGSASNSSNRYGDYASMNLDPVDDCTFWFTGMDNATSVWRTQVASFRFTACGCLQEPSAIVPEIAAPAENEIELGWTDSDLDAVEEYRVLRSRTPGGPYETIAVVPDASPGTADGTAYTYRDLDVSGGTTYVYAVEARDQGPCRSAAAEVSETAFGACTLRPAFAGLQETTFAESSTCSVALGWEPALAECGGPALYNVYRSTEPGFVPGPGNLLVAGVPGTSIVDVNGLVEGETYAYVVRAVDAANGAEDLNAVELAAPAVGPFSGVRALFSESFDDAAAFAAWTVGTGPGNHACGDWVWSDSSAEAPDLGTGGYALSKSEDCRPLLPLTSTFLDSPAVDLDLPGIRSVVLEASLQYRYFDGGDTATVEVWDGAAWQVVWTDPNANVDFRLSVDVTGFAAGNPDFRVRFNYQDANDDRWFSVDDVAIVADIENPCSPAAAPPGAPDGAGPGAALRAERLAPDGSELRVTWDAGCGAAEYHLLYGDLANVATTALDGAACGVGATGSYDWSAAPAGDAFFLIVGGDGADVESSWGEGTYGERNGLAPSPFCGAVYKNVTAVCE